MRVLSLFSGIGAAVIGAKQWRGGGRLVGTCEIDADCLSVLADRLGNAPNIPLTSGAWPRCDLLEAGFPCTDLTCSPTAGGLHGKRTGLWTHVPRIARLTMPSVVMLENVPGVLAHRAEIDATMAMAGYTESTWVRTSAAAHGLPHLRRRVVMVYTRAAPLQRTITMPDPPPPAGFFRWATPAAADNRDRNSFRSPSFHRREAMGKQVNLTAQIGGCANPAWLEAVQGLPVHWTEPGRALESSPPPAYMHPLQWGDSPQHDGEPPRSLRGVKRRKQRLTMLGNTNPPAIYQSALRLSIGA